MAFNKGWQVRFFQGKEEVACIEEKVCVFCGDKNGGSITRT